MKFLIVSSFLFSKLLFYSFMSFHIIFELPSRAFLVYFLHTGSLTLVITTTGTQEVIANCTRFTRQRYATSFTHSG